MSDNTEQDTNKVSATVYTIRLLEAINEKAEQQNKLLQAFVEQNSNNTRYLQAWKQENPELSKRYGKAAKCADTLLREFIDQMLETLDTLEQDEFNDWSVMEFIDKFAPRVCQMQNIVQLLSNLGTT